MENNFNLPPGFTNEDVESRWEDPEEFWQEIDRAHERTVDTALFPISEEANE